MNENQKKIVIGAICVIVAMLLFPPYSFHGPNAITRNLGYAFLFDPPLTGYPNGIPGTVDIGMLLVQWFAVVIVAAALWWLAKDKGYETLLEPKKRADYDADLPKLRPTLRKNGLPDSASDTRNAIWNPNVAANWSLIFTPAFGSYLHMLNWRTLGQFERAASAQHWFYISLAMLAVFILIGASMGNPKAAQSAIQGLAFLYLIVWYFASGRLQGKYVKGEFGSDYPRKPWAAALLIGIVAWTGYFVAAFVIGVATKNIMQRKLISYEEATAPPARSNPFDKFDSKPAPSVDKFGGTLVEGTKPQPGPSWDDVGKPLNGQGTYTWPDGMKYVGEWKDGKLNGQGTQTLPDGGKYVGRFKDNNRHGQGTYTWPNRQKYVGEFKDGMPNGQGTQTFRDGEKYVGRFKDGNRHGQGTETLPNGDKYVGEFKDNNRHGQGTETLPDGGKYVGRFKDNNRHGQGTETLPNGDKYVGEFKDNNRHGQGTYTWSNGQKYVGEFKDGMPNGQGTKYSANGSILQSGIWENGIFAKGQ